MVFPAFRCPRILCLAANEKDFSHSLEMTNAGRRYSRITAFFMRSPWRRHSSSFSWKEVPRRGGGWNRRGMKGNMSKAVSRIVIPSGAEGSFSFAIFCFMRESVCMKHRSSDSQGARCFPLSAAPHPLPCRERKRFLASLEMTIRGKRYSHCIVSIGGARVSAFV